MLYLSKSGCVISMQSNRAINGEISSEEKEPAQIDSGQARKLVDASSQKEILEGYAQRFAFLGNSLLSPMSQTSAIGLEPDFWLQFPVLEDQHVRASCEKLAEWAKTYKGIPTKESAESIEESVKDRKSQEDLTIQQNLGTQQNLETQQNLATHQNLETQRNPAFQQNLATQRKVTGVSVEFTHLFVGPPRPNAYPWETFYRGEGITNGFGHATLEMKQALQEIGLKLDNKNNQYEDHIGIELLYISELCSKGIDAVVAHKSFIEAHPLSWIDRLQASIHAEIPGGYFDLVVGLAKELLISFKKNIL